MVRVPLGQQMVKVLERQVLKEELGEKEEEGKSGISCRSTTSSNYSFKHPPSLVFSPEKGVIT